MAGAMHAAIIAHAFGVPFAFFDIGHRDCPVKWQDWGTSVGLPPSQIAFVRDAKSGKEWYESIKKDLKKTRLLPLLRHANRMARVRPQWFYKAWIYDRFGIVLQK